jgi:hypothetical protein
MTDKTYNFKDVIKNLSYEELVLLDNVIADKIIIGSSFSGDIKSSNIAGEVSVVAGDLRSNNYVANTTGWMMDYLGNLYANSGTFRGTITATTGAIGGFEIGSDYIRDVANTFGLSSEVTVGDDVRFWAGDTFANRATAPFRVTESGAITASNLTHSGGTVGGVAVANVAYVSTSTADSIPTGFSYSTGGISTGSDGSQSAYVVLTWTAISTDTFDHYLIRYKKSALTYYTYITSTTNTITIEGLTPNVSYNFGVASVNKYGSVSSYATVSSLIDSYPTTNSGAYYIMYNDSSYEKLSQSFTAISSILTSCRFYLKKKGSPTGTAYAKLYAHTGAYGTSSVPTGGALATADGFDVSTLTTSDSLITFNFTGDNQYVLSAGTYYCIVIEYSGGDFNNSVYCSYDNTASTHSGNSARYRISGGSWTAQSTDLIFYVYGNANLTQTTASDTTAPVTVTAGSATGGIQYNIVEWTHNIDSDLASYNIYRSETNNSATGVLIGNCRTNYFVDGGRTGGTEYFYWVKAVDTSGNVSASFSTVKSATPRNVTSDDIVTIAGSKVLIDGEVYLSNWRHTSDLTKIDGGNIYTNSITTTQLNFTPVQSTNVIASINASAEGITIDADNITISGSTTFSSGYDPTDYTLSVGGTYDTAASGARVRIFPDANTGIQVIDDEANDVFKTIIGGTDVGDVIFGDWANNEGIYYDKSAGTTTFKGELAAPSGYLGHIILCPVCHGYISSGLTTYNSGVGFWLGHDSSDDIYKFSIGNPGINYLTWDGTSLDFTGGLIKKSFVGRYDDGLTTGVSNATISRKLISTYCSNSTAGYWALYTNGGVGYKMTSSVFNWDNNYDFKAKIIADTTIVDSGANYGSEQFFGLITGSAGSGIWNNDLGNNGTVFFYRHIGFVVGRDNKLYASNFNGTNQTITDISTVTHTNENYYRIIYTAGVSAKFYVNDILLATHTTNLPSGATNPPDILFAGDCGRNVANAIDMVIYNNYELTIN